MNERKPIYYVSEGSVYEIPEIPEVPEPRATIIIARDLGCIVDDSVFALENDNCQP